MHDDDHDSDRVDLSALGPPVMADRLDALVTATVHRGAGDLARRARGGAVIHTVVAWRRPLLAISGLAAAAAIVLLVRPAHAVPNAVVAPARVPAPGGSIAEALGIPAGYTEAVEGSTHGRATP